MPEEIKKPDTQTPAASPEARVPAKPAEAQGFDPRGNRQGGNRGDGREKRNPRRGPRSDSRPRSEYDQKIIAIRRVARVVAGGRRFSFSVAIVAGNRKGQVGVGLGKAGDTSLAIDKALKNAKKNMIKVPLTKTQSIPHEVSTKYASARLMLMPAPGRGLIAGSSVRMVLDLAGVKDVNAKLLSGSKNALNIARVAIQALSELKVRPVSPVQAGKKEEKKEVEKKS